MKDAGQRCVKAGKMPPSLVRGFFGFHERPVVENRDRATSRLSTCLDTWDKAVLTAGAENRPIYVCSGPGTIANLTMVAFSHEAGLELVHLPLEGGGPAMKAMAGAGIHLFAAATVSHDL